MKAFLMIILFIATYFFFTTVALSVLLLTGWEPLDGWIYLFIILFNPLLSGIISVQILTQIENEIYKRTTNQES